MPVVPKVYFSYAWGDDETPGGKLRAEAADALYVYLKEKEARGEVEVVIDQERMSYKSSIRKFTEAYGHAEAIIIFIISEKYLQSVMVSPGKLPQDMTREVFGDADVLDMKIVERKLLELINHQAKEVAQAKETHPR